MTAFKMYEAAQFTMSITFMVVIEEAVSPSFHKILAENFNIILYEVITCWRLIMKQTEYN